ncbi:MAG: ABC transporter ATP-binding protein [Cyanobacteria bacterium P01_F01_bin.150]
MNQVIKSLKSPAFQVVVETARKNAATIFINLSTNLLSAVLEGSTLGIIFLAISFLTEGDNFSSDSTLVLWFLSFFPFPPEQVFLVLIFVSVGLQAILSVSKYINRVAAAYLSAKAQPDVTGKVFERVMSFSYGCVSHYKVGDLVFFSNDAAQAVDRQIRFINDLAISLSFALVYLVIIIRLSPLLAVAATVLSLLGIAMQYKVIPLLRKVVKQVTEVQVNSAKFITESIQALRLIHTFGTQEKTVKHAYYLLEKMQKILKKRAVIFYLSEPILEIFPILSIAILATFTVLNQNNTETILPLLLTFLLALQRLSARVKMFMGTITGLTDNSARMQRLDLILDSRDKQFEQTGQQMFKRLTCDIEFHSVNLSYTNDNVYALQNLDFSILTNQVTALVGESGAGKSSIIDILLGLYQPTSGEILVNGQSLSEYSVSDWRQHIGVVSQDTFIFNTSIIENLRYGNPSASLDQVIEATKAAQAHAFIQQLPDGYDTVVGERGYRLSGGQRQRLALARAIIKQPDILILDEATSALDSESEKLIQQALEQFQKERTVIVVAHRLSTISGADQILVMEQGKVVEKGTHTTLLQQGDRYARYWHLQSDAVQLV